MRPVKRGELLLEVMDPAGEWRLEVDVPENRIGHILEAQQKRNDERLPVSYMLATATEATYKGSLESLSTRSVASESEGTVVPVFVGLADPSPTAPRIAAEVKAKIDCGLVLAPTPTTQSSSWLCHGTYTNPTSSGVGGNPCKSNVARRIKATRSTASEGVNPLASRFARMN